MARRYRALSARAVRGNAGGTAEGFAFRPQDWGGEAFFIVVQLGHPQGILKQTLPLRGHRQGQERPLQ